MTVPNWRAIICIIGLTMTIPVQSNGHTTVNPEHSHCADGRICAGAGYSKDSQRLTMDRCYNVIQLPTSEQQIGVQLNHAISSSELESELGISIRLSGKYEEFSAAPKAHYIRSLQDNDHTMSLHYYDYAMRRVAVQIKGFGDKALTTTGKTLYNKGNNLHFGLKCGDYFISSYQRGALLIMSINIKFDNPTEKKIFNEKAKVIFGTIVSAVKSIKNVSARYKLTGSITIQAFQLGGKPYHLSKMFNNSSPGYYHALECSFTKIDNCRKIAHTLLHYATGNFPKQFSLRAQTGLTPLSIEFTQYQPIEWIGLIPPVSLVTKEVVQYRKDLSSKLKEMEYYRLKLHPFFNNGYPVQLDDKFINEVNLIASKVNSNLRILMQPHNGSAADCFEFPHECKNIKANIDSHFENITTGDLSFLKNIKYTVSNKNVLSRNTPKDLEFYNTGGELAKSWNFTHGVRNVRVNLKRIQITDETCSFTLRYVHNDLNITWIESFRGTLMRDAKKYAGIMCYYDKSVYNLCVDCKLPKKLSPFFFEAYQNIRK